LLEAQAEISRLNTALDYARHAEEYRKQLISNITHELKTPLAVVHSYTEGLQSEIAPEKKERYLQVILDEAERMDGMVMQMLELSRLEAGRVKLKMEYFDLGAVIRDVAERFEPLMAEKELKLRLELGGQEQMNGDEGRIEQVITNFMSNAVKYSTPGGEILVKAVFGKLGLYFSITNNAKHLSEEGLQKVFDSFYREDAARTEKSTGLGLAIVKNIMNLHGFRCYVNNTMLNDQPAVEFGFRRE
jgi:signal transduction histidine kinase